MAGCAVCQDPASDSQELGDDVAVKQLGCPQAPVTLGWGHGFEARPCSWKASERLEKTFKIRIFS